ncbi:membrane protease YdiL (CAAX protease family) [Naumannella cuiyingiana]|uniref:Membrane protease YdiL (CAAX protease family) n=1 Tax=Naumannella cuiyingiana TaxID=1347891 RepID=A0A7Z0D724_9ACTN|nr:CPBP family glutamic-type intramembrane protease [Naumannella cuiyingiana]NYI70067.1 membrane protease YdiL (CAAX protease family) [Naumannella cuiyingiana]
MTAPPPGDRPPGAVPGDAAAPPDGFPPPAAGFAVPPGGFPPAPGPGGFPPAAVPPGAHHPGAQPGPPVAYPPGAPHHPVPMAHPGRPPMLPVEPRNYYRFYRTPALRWWRPLVGIVFFVGLGFVASLVFGAIGFGVDIATGRTDFDALSPAELEVTPATFVANNLGLAALIGIAILAQLIFFGQRPGWLASVDGKLRWGWLARCFGAALVGYLLMYVVLGLLEPFPPFGNDPDFGLYLAFTLLTTPLQAAGEEYAFRGFLPRAIASWIPHRWVGMILAWVLCSMVFMTLHGAGDVWLNVYYFCFGMIMSIATWLTGGLGVAIALHVVNNLVSLIVAFYAGEGGSLFERGAGTVNPVELVPNVVVLVVLSVVLVWWASRRGLRRESAPAAVAGRG